MISRRLRAAHRGQATVEFALTATILMLLTMGIVDFSMAVWEYNTVSYLAREGARFGISPSKTPAEIQNHVFQRAVGLPSFTAAACAGRSPACVVVRGQAALPSLTPQYSPRGTCGSTSDPVLVTVNFPYTASSGLIGTVTGGAPINMQASASMYVEQGVAGVGACWCVAGVGACPP